MERYQTGADEQRGIYSQRRIYQTVLPPPIDMPQLRAGGGGEREGDGMKQIYRGYEIDAHREPSMGGDSYLYFSVYAVDNDDKLKPCLEDSFTSGEDTAREYIGYLKKMVDDFYAHPEHYADDGWQPPETKG